MNKYEVVLDKGRKGLKSTYDCDLCSKRLPNSKNMFKITTRLKQMDEIRYVRFVCSKECVNLLILKGD